MSLDAAGGHEHNSDSYFEKLLQDAQDKASEQDAASGSGHSLQSDEQLRDNFYPEEQKNRSHYISSILGHYERAYRNKATFQNRYRKILFWGCAAIILLFAAAILLILKKAADNIVNLDLTGVVALITAMASLAGSILSLVHTITKYCFPENDEEYIVNIVRSIQENDLEKIKEANRAAEAQYSQMQHREASE